jgi:hypothetical protein
VDECEPLVAGIELVTQGEWRRVRDGVIAEWRNSSGRGLHVFRFQLNSSSVHRVTLINPDCVLELLKLSSNGNECKPLSSGVWQWGCELAAGGGELVSTKGRAVQVAPMKPELKPPGTNSLKLKCDTLLSTSAFKFNLRC